MCVCCVGVALGWCYFELLAVFRSMLPLDAMVLERLQDFNELTFRDIILKGCPWVAVKGFGIHRCLQRMPVYFALFCQGLVGSIWKAVVGCCLGLLPPQGGLFILPPCKLNLFPCPRLGRVQQKPFVTIEGSLLHNACTSGGRNVLFIAHCRL